MGFLKKIFLAKKCAPSIVDHDVPDRREPVEEESCVIHDTGVRKRNSSPPFTALIKDEIVQRKSDVPGEKRAHSVVELQRTSEAEPWGLVLLSGGGNVWGAGTACPRIAHLPPGSLAHRSDMLLQGDVLTSVNGISTRGMRADDVTALVESAKTKLVLDVEYEIPPAQIGRPAFVKYKVWTPRPPLEEKIIDFPSVSVQPLQPCPVNVI